MTDTTFTRRAAMATALAIASTPALADLPGDGANADRTGLFWDGYREWLALRAKVDAAYARTGLTIAEEKANEANVINPLSAEMFEIEKRLANYRCMTLPEIVARADMAANWEADDLLAGEINEISFSENVTALLRDLLTLRPIA